MASEVKFFDTANAVTGTWSDWTIQSGPNASLSWSKAQSLKADGDEARSTRYGLLASYSESYEAATVTGTTGLTIPSAGQVSNGALIDSVTVTYSQTAAPKMTLSAHKHGDSSGTLQTHDSGQTYAATVVLPARAIGVPSTLKDTGNNTIFTLPSGCGMRSITYTLKATHVDEPDGEGYHLKGQCRDGVEELKLEFTGKIVTSELSIDSGWSLDADADGNESNTTATTKTITLTKHIAHTTTSAS